MITLEAIEALVQGSAMTKEETWEMVEEISELDYDEFEALWAKRKEREVVQ